MVYQPPTLPGLPASHTTRVTRLLHLLGHPLPASTGLPSSHPITGLPASHPITELPVLHLITGLPVLHLITGLPVPHPITGLPVHHPITGLSVLHLGGYGPAPGRLWPCSWEARRVLGGVRRVLRGVRRKRRREAHTRTEASSQDLPRALWPVCHPIFVRSSENEMGSWSRNDCRIVTGKRRPGRQKGLHPD